MTESILPIYKARVPYAKPAVFFHVRGDLNICTITTTIIVILIYFYDKSSRHINDVNQIHMR